MKTPKIIPVFFVNVHYDSGEIEVIAVFPEAQCSCKNNIGNYAHVGQHGEAEKEFIKYNCRPAAQSEYADLYRELQGIYNDDKTVLKLVRIPGEYLKAWGMNCSGLRALKDYGADFGLLSGRDFLQRAYVLGAELSEAGGVYFLTIPNTEQIFCIGTREAVYFDKMRTGDMRILRKTISIKWSVADVAQVAKDNCIPLTLDECARVLDIVRREHDAEFGVTWDSILYCIRHYFPDRKSLDGSNRDED